LAAGGAGKAIVCVWFFHVTVCTARAEPENTPGPPTSSIGPTGSFPLVLPPFTIVIQLLAGLFSYRRDGYAKGLRIEEQKQRMIRIAAGDGITLEIFTKTSKIAVS